MSTTSEAPATGHPAAHTTIRSSLGGLRRKRILLDLGQDAAGRPARLF